LLVIYATNIHELLKNEIAFDSNKKAPLIGEALFISVF
jgi:hypothetical protein